MNRVQYEIGMDRVKYVWTEYNLTTVSTVLDTR